ncbi:MAG: hypothetical protein SF028_05655 [Candidatus Sumerlaeia bacterium]|nr:hypothetical protein [Candidatus Sumerlaeia bacterium]
MPLSHALDWFRDAVIYELSARAFRDSSRDGDGDFRGLAEKPSYLVALGPHCFYWFELRRPQ